MKGNFFNKIDHPTDRSLTKNNQNIVFINLSTKKNKNIKEKNIKNEITKYEISLNVNVRFNLINSDTNYKINLSNKRT